MKTSLACLLTVLVLNVSGCNVYDSTLVEQGSAGVPDRPPESTSSPEDNVEAVFALRNVSLDQSGDRWRRVGLDLDGMNTASVDDPAECVAANGNPSLDGDKGIDNSFGQHVLPTVASLIACLEDNIALNQGLGFGTVLVRLREWNGTPNDAKVDVSVLSAVDGTSLDDLSGLEWGGANGATLMQQGGSVEAPPPDWDGEDFFFADPASLVAGDIDRPNVWTTDAYVSKGRVVLPVDTSATFTFLTGPGSFSISVEGFLVGDISEDGQTFTKGLLAGRFSAGRLVATMLPLGICDESLRETVVGLLTDNLDLRIDKELGSPGDPCTATSVAFAFQAIRARLATTIAPVPLPVPEPCAGGGSPGVQPAFDRCCRSVEVNTPELLPAECSPADLAPYSNLPNPIPVPLVDGF
ncbi:MAG: hypothetical protein OEM15_06460 [Myxococcales bacterium]|nr:hypothetical protein [Myxococcales bacterium]MDH3484345.1 hypothetical protein [Myxococcales bacterium]